MITDPRFNDPSYILNKIDKSKNATVTYSIDEKQISGPKFYYPRCGESCLDSKLSTIPGANYIFEDGRCLKAVSACNKYDCLVDTTYVNSNDPSVNGNFISCSQSFDTRIKGTTARFIRIEKGRSVFPVSINSIQAYNIFGTYIQPILGRAYPTDGDNYGINLLNTNPGKIATTLNTDDAYVQIDLGKDYTVYMVSIINIQPFSNIIGNNLVLIDEHKKVTMRYPINFGYDIYYITTKYDHRYIPENDEYIVFETYKYPSCIDEGCIYNGSVIQGYKYTFDKPIPLRDEDLLIPYDNRCFNTSSKCDNYCLTKIIKGEFMDDDINQYFVSCDDSINTLKVRIPGKYLRIERTDGSILPVELSEFEAFDNGKKHTFTEIKSFPLNNNYPPNNLVDGNDTTITKTMPQTDARIQCKLPFNDTMLSYVHVSIPNTDLNNLFGTTLFVVNKFDIIVHNFTFTIESVNTLTKISKDPNVTTYKIYIDGTGNLVNKKKNMTDIFDYPSCIANNCIVNGAQLNNSIYKLPDGRCVKTITECIESECLTKLKDNTLSIGDIENNFQSCSELTDTRIIPSYGRYIRIQRENNNKGFDLPEIYVYGRSSELLINSSTSYPLTIVSGVPLHTKNAYDRNVNIYASVRDSTSQQKPFMQFDLGENKMITKIRLEIMNETLNGTKLYILNDKNEIVFSADILGTIAGRTTFINTASIGSQENLPTMSTRTNYLYPECVSEGCTPDGHFISGQVYENLNNQTCFVAKSNDTSCLKNLGRLYGAEMDSCFSICDTEDTRYGSSLGRFVRIKNLSGSVMTISEISALNKNNITYPIINAFSKGVTDIGHRSDGLISKNAATSVTGVGSYVQIDLGSDSEIYSVKINGTIGSCVIEVINALSMVVSSKSVTGAGTYSARQNIQPIIVNPPIEESFEYPTCNNEATFKDCVDVNGKAKPLYKYNTTTGACGIAKTACSECLTKLNDGTLSLSEADNYFRSCSVGETRYPSLRARYLRIQSFSQGFKIKQFNAFDSELSGSVPISVSDTFAYPSDTGTSNILTGSSVTNILSKIDNIDPFIQLDLGEDKIVKQVRIVPDTGDNSLSNTILYLINNAGTTVFQKSLSSFTSPILISAIPGSYTKLELSNSFVYPECKVNSCLTNNHQVLNQKYNIGNRCFKAINTSTESACLSNALTLFGPAMDACFSKCGTEDTRYAVLVGKYIRITRTSDLEMKISEIKANNLDGTAIQIYSTYAFGCNDIDHRSDKLNVTGNYTSVTGVNSYIQVMFEREEQINTITISVPSGNTFNNLVGTIIQVLSESGSVVYEFEITASMSQLSDLTKTFKANMNTDGSKKLTVTAEYSYPSCSTSSTDFECVTENGKSKPGFKYNFPQDRCAIAINKCTTADCMNKLNLNTLTSTEMNADFKTCDPNKITQYPSVSGRYIRLERGLTNLGFSIAGIEAYDVNKLNAAHTRSFPLGGTNYSQYMKDSTDISPPTTVGSAISDASGTIIKPFVQLDYSSDVKIQKIILTTVPGDNSIDGTILKVINNNGTTVYQANVSTVTGKNDYTFYTVDIPGTNKNDSVLINSFNYDSCVSQGCIDEDKQIDKQIYNNTSDGRCLKSKGYLPVSQCLGVINSLSGTAMDACFDTCTNGMETRYPRLLARFIRLRRYGSNGEEIKLFKLIATGTNQYGAAMELTVISKHCKPIISSLYASDNLNEGGQNPAGAIGLSAYVQIDLGQNIQINSVKLNWVGSIVNTELIAITQEGLVKHSTRLTESEYATAGEKVLPVSLNIPNPSENIITSETYNYPETKNTYDGGLDKNNKPKISFIYNLNDGLSVKVKALCTINDCLSNVNNNTMTKADMDTYFLSTNDNYDTRFPNPSARYVRIQRTNATKNGFSFTSIIFTTDGTELSSTATLVYPKVSTFATSNIIEEPAADEPGKPFIQFDFDINKRIQFIRIVTTDESLRGTTMYVINTNGITVYQRSLDDIITGINNIQLLKFPEATKMDVPMSYKFAYNTCKTKGCIGVDNRHYENQMYKLPDGRCLKAIGRKLITECLDNIDNLTGSTMDACFRTCVDGIETRYPALNARFIRIRQKNNRTSDIKLFKLIAYGPKLNGSVGELDIVTKHCKPVISITYASDNLNKGLSNPAGAIGTNAYVQIDLGKDTQIDSVKINWAGSINGTELVIINQAGLVRHSTILDSALYSSTGENTVPVNLNIVTVENITIPETYTYPATKNTFDGGLDENNKPKLLYIYNMDNGLSVKVKAMCANNDCLSNVYNNTMTKTDMDNYFLSTNNNYDTRFPNPTVRYIRIQRSDGTRTGFGFSAITFSGDSTVVPTNTLVYPLRTSPFTTDTIVNTPNNDEPGAPFVQFDFGSLNKIKYVNITTVDNSLNGTTLYAIDTNGTTVMQKNLNGLVTGINSIELLKIYGENSTNVPKSYKFNLDTCKPLGCTPGNAQFDNQMYYIPSDLRCFKAKGYQNLGNCLNLIDSLSGDSMDACFDTCVDRTETRYPALTARFVRIRQGSTRNSDIKLFKLIANGPLVSGSEGPLNIITKHCHSIISQRFKSDNLNVNGITDPAGATGFDAYIQIDLGNNVRINTVTIKRSGSIDGTELIVITEDGYMKHLTNITDAMFTSGDEIIVPVNLNRPTNESVEIIETFRYPNTKNNYDGGLDENNKPKILYRYDMDNGLSVIPIATCPLLDCLNDVYNNRLPMIEMNRYFITTSRDYDTRFPNPMGQYIIIQRSDRTMNGFTITGIEIKGDNTDVWEPLQTIVYPLVSGYTTSTITGPLTSNEPNSPFVYLDFGYEKKIKFVKITTTDSTLIGTTLYVIGSNKNTIAEVSLNNVRPGVNTIEILKVPGSFGKIRIEFKFKYDSCKTRGCISSDENHYEGQMYETADLRCYKAIGNQSIIDCLDKIKNSGELYDPEMSLCFDSCYPTYDSRYPNSFGRFIRLSRVGKTGADISLVSMVAYSPAVTNGSTPTAIVPITAHAKNPINSTSYGINLIDGLSNTIAACNSAGYLQIDLGSDMYIKHVVLTTPTANSSSLIGTKLQVIKNDGSIIHETLLNESNYTYSSSSLLINTEQSKTGNDKEVLTEIYTWPCESSDCVGPNQRTKPKFKYNISGNRCLLAKDTGLDNIITNVDNYSLTADEILRHFDSCEAGYSTQFTSITGRYVRIRRTGSTTGPISIADFKIKDKSGNVLTNPNLKTYAKPLKTISAGNYSYGKYMVDTDPITATVTNTISGTPIDATLDKGYVQIDLGEDKEIGYIEIYHNGNVTDAGTLATNTELVIVSSSGSIVYRQPVPAAINAQRIILIQNMPIEPGYVFSNSEIFNYPGCKEQGCLTEDNKLITDFRYNVSEGRCFKAINDTTMESILINAINKDQSININNYFVSCDPVLETRYTPAIGRYIRVERTDSREVKLSRLEARDTAQSFITPIDVHVKPAIAAMISNGAYESIKNANVNTDVSTDIGPITYIQLDLGSDITVREIILNPASTDPNGISYLNGSILYFIKQDGTVTYQVPLNSTTLSTSTFVVY